MHPRIDPPATVLLVRPEGSARDDCAGLRTVENAGARLRISIGDREASRGFADGPDRTAVVSIGERPRPALESDAPDVVERVEDPTDLPAIGRAASRICERWAGIDGRIVVCVRSLDALLDRVESETAFRFVHLLAARFERVDALAHVHLDPAACDEDEVVAVFGTLFDAVVEGDEPIDEATDGDVASALSGDDEPVAVEVDVPSEATDEEITRVLEDE